MKLLVTGANGLVGSAIRRQNPSNTIYITREDVDLRDFEKTKKIFKEIAPTHVIHAAAVVGGIGGNLKMPGTFFRENTMINVNVLEAARLSGVKKLLSYISTCAWPDKVTYPLTEIQLHAGPPHDSNFAYAHAKRMVEVQSRAYRKEWGCNFIVGVGTNIYGPNDNFSLENGHVLPALVHRCFFAKQSGDPLTVWGSGKPLREFVLSDDIARLSLWALESYDEELPIIFSSGIETTIKDAVESIASSMDFKGQIVFDAGKPDGQLRKPSDDSRLKKYLPDFKFTPVSDGVQKTVEWFVKNYPKVRT
jgi:GDP-L-fucose synthase